MTKRLRRLVTNFLFSIATLLGTLLYGQAAMATATYQGTMSGSISIVSCSQQGVLLASCGFALGLDISGLISEPSLNGGTAVTLGTGVANVTSTINTFGPGTFVPHPFIPGALRGDGLSNGSGYSMNILISGSASDPGAGAASIGFESGDFFFINSGPFVTTVTAELSYQYQASININDPLTELAFTSSLVDVRLSNFFSDPPIVASELFNSNCANILPPQFGLPSAPCSGGPQTVQFSFDVPVCVAVLCTAFFIDSRFSQLGAATVNQVPEPASVALLLFGLGSMGLWSKRRRRQTM